MKITSVQYFQIPMSHVPCLMSNVQCQKSHVQLKLKILTIPCLLELDSEAAPSCFSSFSTLCHASIAIFFTSNFWHTFPNCNIHMHTPIYLLLLFTFTLLVLFCLFSSSGSIYFNVLFRSKCQSFTHRNRIDT